MQLFMTCFSSSYLIFLSFGAEISVFPVMRCWPVLSWGPHITHSIYTFLKLKTNLNSEPHFTPSVSDSYRAHGRDIQIQLPFYMPGLSILEGGCSLPSWAAWFQVLTSSSPVEKIRASVSCSYSSKQAFSQAPQKVGFLQPPGGVAQHHLSGYFVSI